MPHLEEEGTSRGGRGTGQSSLLLLQCMVIGTERRGKGGGGGLPKGRGGGCLHGRKVEEDGPPHVPPARVVVEALGHETGAEEGPSLRQLGKGENKCERRSLVREGKRLLGEGKGQRGSPWVAPLPQTRK